jgi:hypothetical protein
VRRAFASSLFSVLLLITLVWGGCISCERYFMFGGAKSCCSPNGHCKTKPSPSQNTDRQCKQIAFNHHKSLDLHIDLPIFAVVKVELPMPTVEALEYCRGAHMVEPSPPDLQILHSTFLI